MSLESYSRKGQLKQHVTTPTEINKLLRIVKRDINDASISQVSTDRRFMTAYNAGLQLSTILLRASGYRTNSSRGGHHWVTFSVLPEVLGEVGTDYANYFEACRIKRNVSDYQDSGEISETEANEILQEAIKFNTIVVNWLKEKYPAYEELTINA